MDETPALGAVNVAGVGNEVVAGARAAEAQNHRRILMEYAQLSIDGTASCIRKPTVQANNFDLKPSYVNMIQNSVQFHGLFNKDPNLHSLFFRYL